jgi:hypothetical protein
MVFDERPVGQPIPPADQKFLLNQSREELEKVIGNTTELIWECTQPDPKTQCFTKVFDNGTIFVGNGKPDPTEVTKAPDNPRKLTVETDEADEYVASSGSEGFFE